MSVSIEEARLLWPHPKKLTLEELNNLPYMAVCQGFLSVAEADKIVELSEKKGFEKSHTGSTTQGSMYGAMNTGNPYGKIHFFRLRKTCFQYAFLNVMPSSWARPQIQSCASVLESTRFLCTSL